MPCGWSCAQVENSQDVPANSFDSDEDFQGAAAASGCGAEDDDSALWPGQGQSLNEAAVGR